MNTLLTIDVVAVALFAGFCVAKVIPSCNMSIFRYRLWHLRDRLADQIREGAFDDDKRPAEFLNFVEGAIEIAPDIGAVKLFFVRWSSRGILRSNGFTLEGLSQKDRSLLGRYRNDCQQLLVRHVLFGNPSGWALTAIAVPVALTAALVEHLRQGDGDKRSVIGDARSRVRDEVDPGPTLLAGQHSRSGRSLSHMI